MNRSGLVRQGKKHLPQAPIAAAAKKRMLTTPAM
jgi:hypothetical protein